MAEDCTYRTPEAVDYSLRGLPEEDQIDRGELESRAVTDLGEGLRQTTANFGARLAEGFEVSLPVRNLTDETYADHLNAPEPV